MGVRYRLRQGLAYFDPRVPAAERAAALALLSDDEQTLFRRLAPVDQRHSLAVYRAAAAERPDDSALQAAAMLHDVGKGRPGILDRALLTLVEENAPWLLLRWLRRPAASRRGRIARLARHTEASARFAELAQAHPAVVDTLRSYGFREHARGRLLAELDAER